MHSLLSHVDSDRAAERCELSFELSDSGFARVPRDEHIEGVLGEHELARAQPMLRELLREQVPLGDLHLLLYSIPVHLNELHTVPEGPWDGVEVVGG